ncbi:MAG: MotA/TolQ/ExbB proton channel family protein [Deltaproteobacteria bacterium]|nr:MotA/TolQ/ExbB proton channel family protein [Deltaproteobacteria bacterium]
MVVIEYIRSGGPVMVPILLASVVAVATILERLWALRRERVLPSSFRGEIFELIRQNRWGDALAVCRKRDVAAARLLEIALLHRGEPRERIKERMEEIGRRESAELERNVPMLGTIGSVSTLLGLLGTVGGMILTFQVVGASEEARAQDMAVGISQALVCTFGGLSVAILAVVANRSLLTRVDALTLDLEEFSIEVLDQLEGSAPEPREAARA